MFILGVLWYSNPISESMTCDKNYQCKIEHFYMGNFKNSDNIKISPNWVFDEAMSGNARYQERHIIYSTDVTKNKLLFKKGLCSFKEGDVNAYNKCRNDISTTLNSIKTYIDNPENPVTIYANGGINYLQKYFLVIIFLYIIGMLSNSPITSVNKLFYILVEKQIQNMEYKKESKEYYGINTKDL